MYGIEQSVAVLMGVRFNVTVVSVVPTVTVSHMGTLMLLLADAYFLVVPPCAASRARSNTDCVAENSQDLDLSNSMIGMSIASIACTVSLDMVSVGSLICESVNTIS